MDFLSSVIAVAVNASQLPYLHRARLVVTALNGLNFATTLAWRWAQEKWLVVRVPSKEGLSLQNFSPIQTLAISTYFGNLEHFYNAYEGGEKTAIRCENIKKLA